MNRRQKGDLKLSHKAKGMNNGLKMKHELSFKSETSTLHARFIGTMSEREYSEFFIQAASLFYNRRKRQCFIEFSQADESFFARNHLKVFLRGLIKLEITKIAFTGVTAFDNSLVKSILESLLTSDRKFVYDFFDTEQEALFWLDNHNNNNDFKNHRLDTVEIRSFLNKIE
jgi:hypothetical protein